MSEQTNHSIVGTRPTATPTHCLFRRGVSWFALPAFAVREVMPLPDMVRVPGTSDTFAGLCHVRSEFLPVLNLNSALSELGACDEPILLILDDTDGPWGVLVDEVSALQTLEVSDAPETEVMGDNCAVVGWATQDANVIQVLDQARIRQQAEAELAAIWQSPDLLADVLTPTTAGAKL